jgi:hypothetical protein
MARKPTGKTRRKPANESTLPDWPEPGCLPGDREALIERIDFQTAASTELCQRFWHQHDAETTRCAISYWSGYPLLFYGTFPEARASFNATHEAAVRYLMKLASQHGLDPAPLYEAGRVCRELFASGNLQQKESGAVTDTQWPECLGQRRYQLSEEERRLIRDGQAVFCAAGDLVGPEGLAGREGLEYATDLLVTTTESDSGERLTERSSLLEGQGRRAISNWEK